MTGETYNGWTNYPTWAVALWLGNDPGTEKAVRELARTWNQRTAEKGGTTSELADDLRAFVVALPEVDTIVGSEIDSSTWKPSTIRRAP